MIRLRVLAIGVVASALASFHVRAITAQSRAPVPPPTVRATAIVAGSLHTCAVMADATVRCWGSNERGQLGAPAPGDCRLVDVTLTLTPSPPVPRRGTPIAVALTDVTQIGAASESTCALLRDGTVRCWGSNVAGVVGDGTTTDRASPVAVVGLSGAAQIAVGATEVQQRAAVAEVVDLRAPPTQHDTEARAHT